MKVCVVGAGSIGERHARVFSKLPGVDGVCVVEPRAERVEELRQRYPQFEFHSRLEDAPPGQYHLCSVCVPAPLHMPVATTALERGMHTLIEKPLTTNLAEVGPLARLAESRKLTVGVAHVYRFIPELVRLREELQAGAIGEVKHVRFLSGQHFPTVRPDYNKIYFARRAMGGGVLLDFACHSVDYFQWLCGRATEVAAVAERMMLDEIETEDLADVLLRFENGARGAIHVNAAPYLASTTSTSRNGAVNSISRTPESRSSLNSRAVVAAVTPTTISQKKSEPNMTSEVSTGVPKLRSATAQNVNPVPSRKNAAMP